MKIALDFLEQFIVKNGVEGTCLNRGRGGMGGGRYTTNDVMP